jgi:hypothetical protein
MKGLSTKLKFEFDINEDLMTDINMILFDEQKIKKKSKIISVQKKTNRLDSSINKKLF